VLLQRSTRARIYGDLTDDLDAAIDETTYPVLSGLAQRGTRTAAQLAGDIGIDQLTEYGNNQNAMRARLYGEFDEYLASRPPERARNFVEGFVRFVKEGPFAAAD
jgi:hypothetical protein